MDMGGPVQFMIIIYFDCICIWEGGVREAHAWTWGVQSNS
jgi:hypothetical protein